MPHTPRKRFGQHFLHDPAVIDRIVMAINLLLKKVTAMKQRGRGLASLNQSYQKPALYN